MRIPTEFLGEEGERERRRERHTKGINEEMKQ